MRNVSVMARCKDSRTAIREPCGRDEQAHREHSFVPRWGEGRRGCASAFPYLGADLSDKAVEELFPIAERWIGGASIQGRAYDYKIRLK